MNWLNFSVDFTTFFLFLFHPPAECSLMNKAPPTPTMYKYRPTYSPGKNHTALTHAYANQVIFGYWNVSHVVNN